MEVKSAMLREWHNGPSVLIIVDENYEIHSMSGDHEVFQVLLENVELPNFKWVRVSGDKVYYAEGTEYKGRYYGGFSLKVLEQYRKSEKVA